MKKKSVSMRIASVLMATALVVSGFPGGVSQKNVKAAEGASSDNAFKAIGINSNVVPDGFDEDDTDTNPYGKKTVTANQADEVFCATMGKDGSAIIGQNQTSVGKKYTYSVYTDPDHSGDFWKSGTVTDEAKWLMTYQNGSYYDMWGLGASSGTVADVEGSVSTVANNSNLQSNFMNKTAGGNFDGNLNGKKTQFAMVSFDEVNKKLYLSVNSAIKNTTSNKKELGWRLSSDMISFQNNAKAVDVNKNDINISDEKIQKLQAIAYMNIITGDFDGNGIDEIAVYNPKSSDNVARVEVYGLKTSPDSCDIYDMNSWEIKRTIQTEGDYFVSMDSGDLNQDGIDDLVVGCNTKATIYSGDRLDMLKKADKEILEIPKVYFQLVDPSVTVFQEKNGGKTNTYLGILSMHNDYGYLSVYQYVNNEYVVIATDKGDGYDFFKNASKSSSTENIILRMPLELHYANHHFFTPYGDEKAIEFKENQLNYVSAKHVCIHPFFNYTEGLIPYDFQVADLNGDGIDTVFYKAWCVNSYADQYPFSMQPLYISRFYKNMTAGDYMGAYSPKSDGPMIPLNMVRTPSNYPVYAIVNTDDDTTYMTYTGKHSFEYTNPEVLAVLSSPPYFKDLLANDNLSGNYAESTTSYGKTSGSGQSASAAATISAGAYERIEQEVSILGLGNLAQAEAEISWNASFTAEYEQASEINYSTEYSTSSGADAVVFYSIPTEIYEYDTTYYDKKTGKSDTYKKYLYFPKTPCTATIELDKYKAIAENYSELPTIDDTILKHRLGYPSTYPVSSAGYKNVKEFKGNWLGVDFTSAGGGITQTQSIEMSKEHETSFSSSVEMSVSAGAGAGGVTVGVTAGAGVEAGYAMTSTSGNSYTATMQNMPAEAEEYGYGMSWKMFAHEGSYTNKNGDTVKYPVVDYMVRDVMAPPEVPENLRQDYDSSTPDSINLLWDYENVSGLEGFNIYRVTNIDGSEASILAGTIAAAAGTKQEDGSYSFSFTDDGTNDDGSKTTLYPGVEYGYYIEATRSRFNPPSISMPSETISAYTRSDGEYPDISLKGIVNNSLTIFPDRTYDIQVKVNNKADFMQVSYQWQKYSVKEGWVDLKDGKKDTLSIEDATVDMAGEYRCRVDAIVYNAELKKQSSVRTFTDVLILTYKMRSVEVQSIEATSTGKKPEVVVTLKPVAKTCMVAPSGDVRFVLENDNTQVSYTVPLKTGSGYTATAKLSDSENISDLADGNYKVTAYYSGDEVFASFTSETQNLVIGEDAIYPVLTDANGKITNTFAYGDVMRIDFYKYTKDASGHTVETKLKDEGRPDGYSATITNAPGTYTTAIGAKLEGEAKILKYSFNVTKRPIEVGVSANNLQAGNITTPVATLIKGNLVSGDSLSQLVSLKFMNEDKTSTITLDNSTAVGYYNAVLEVTNHTKVKYYDIDLYSTEIYVSPKLYDVAVKAELCEGKQAGTITMTKPESRKGLTDEALSFETNTAVKLTAVPKTGYKFDHWEIKEGTNTRTSDKVNLSMNIKPLSTTIKAVFTDYTFKVTIDDSYNTGGKVSLPEGFVSGNKYQVGTELVFTAQTDNELAPDYWIRSEGRKTYYTYGPVLKLIVPEADVILYPVFKGRPCKVEIGEGVIAEYTYVNDQDDTITERIKNGDYVPKKSEISLSVGNSMTDYIWYVNDKEIARNKATSFILEGDAKIELRPIEADKPDPGDNKCSHANIEVRGFVASTKEQAGYSGDTYCKDCGEMVTKGTEIPKIEDATTTPATTEAPSPSTPDTTEAPTSTVDKNVVDGVGTLSDDGKKLTDTDKTVYLVAEKLTVANLKKSANIADKKSGIKYKITKVTKKKGKVNGGTVEVMKPYNLNAKTVTIPATVKLKGVTFKVTTIKANAFIGSKATKVTIGKNIIQIKNKAFFGVSSIKTVVIKGTGLSKIGTLAFKGINPKAKYSLPKKKATKYKSMLKKAGAPLT